jgi:hypothetical protein
MNHTFTEELAIALDIGYVLEKISRLFIIIFVLILLVIGNCLSPPAWPESYGWIQAKKEIVRRHVDEC